MTDQIIKSESINHKRWRKLKSLKRGYYSFILITTLYILSLFLPLFINSKALVVQYEGEYYFPAFSEVIPWVSTYYDGELFGQDIPGSANFRQLQKSWEDSDNWLIMPIYPYNPFEDITNNENRMYESPSTKHWLGTDNTGRDVLARMCYAFNISISFVDKLLRLLSPINNLITKSNLFDEICVSTDSLKIANAYDVVMNLPLKLDTYVGER